jgi:hypothetical protein
MIYQMSERKRNNKKSFEWKEKKKEWLICISDTAQRKKVTMTFRGKERKKERKTKRKKLEEV